MSKPAIACPIPSTKTEVRSDVAVAAAVELAMEFYGRDAVTAVALRAVEARDCGQESHFRFWLGVFKSLKARPDFLPDLRLAR
jgi:hypothetical protein